MIKSFLLLFSIILPLQLFAQNTYTEKIRQNEQGKGSVILNHTPEIERVVNGTMPQTNKDNKKAETPNKQTITPHSEKKNEHPSASTHPSTVTNNNHGNRQTNTKEDNKKTTAKHSYTNRARKKAKGYRICIFTGGNSRSDKMKATQMGNKCRQYFPELAVYPSFEAPRWVTHVGDFRTREEAQKYVTRIRKSKISYEVRIVSSNVNIPY